MRRARQTQFAAPFVMVVTAGCGGHGKAGEGTRVPEGPLATWSVNKQGDTCWAEPHVDCPPDGRHTCNPPAPMNMKCPPGAPDSFQVVKLAGGRCFLDDRKTEVACPSYDAPPPAIDAAALAIAARWEIVRNADGTCGAMDDPCSRMQLKPGDPIPPCNPPVPIMIACPPADVRAIVAVSAGECRAAGSSDCMADPRAQCATAPTQPIDCPHY